MKRGWLALALLLTAIAAGAGEYLWIGTNTRVCVDMLNEADAMMERNEIYEATELSERLDNRFAREADIYDVFLFHSEVMDISRELAALRRYAQTGETGEFLATSARIKRALLSLADSRVPRMENVL